MQPPSPVAQRLRTVRRRVSVGVIAAFVAAWLAVAILGKGGTASTAKASGSSGSSTPTQSQSEDNGQFDDGSGTLSDGASGQSDQGSASGQSDQGSAAGQSDQGGASSQPGPVTTGQS
jgi:hypothetical protein